MREIYLEISRLTDPPKIAGRDNFVLDRVLEHALIASDAAALREIELLLEEARRLAGPFRAHRHKYLAHKDFEHALGRAGPTLPGIDSDTVDLALSAMAALYNAAAMRVLGEGAYFGKVFDLGGARALMLALNSAQKWEAYERDRPDAHPGAGDAA